MPALAAALAGAVLPGAAARAQAPGASAAPDSTGGRGDAPRPAGDRGGGDRPGGGQAPAAGARPPSWHVWNGTALGFNPMVLGDQVKVFRKLPYGDGTPLLLSDAHARLGASLTASPTFVHPELAVGFAPLLVLDVELHAGPAWNDLHYTFPSYGAPYDAASRGAQPWRTGRYWEGAASVVLRAAVGRLALLAFGDFVGIQAADKFFHWDYGTIVGTGGGVRAKAMLLWQAEEAWRAYAVWQTFHWAPSGYTVHFAGAGVYREGLPGGFTGLVQAGWHVANPDLHGPGAWLAVFHDWDFPDGTGATPGG